MPIRKKNEAGPVTGRLPPSSADPELGLVAAWARSSLALGNGGRKKDVAFEAMDSDANGYLCLKCGVKLYTDRTVFIGPQCPKCQQETLNGCGRLRM